jgi:hypothetical protein
MRSIKLYGTGSGVANAVAQVTIPSRATLVGIQAAIGLDQVADNSNVALEISKASATEVAVNGAQQCIAVFRSFGNLATNGTPGIQINGFFPVNVELDQGQILYLHSAVCTTTTYYAEFVLWLK